VHRPRERGIVLVWAIAIVATLTVLGASLGRLLLGVQEATWQLAARGQIDALTRSAVTITAVVLEAHVATGAADTLDAPWSERTRHELGAGWAEVEVEDVARRIDLNASELRPVLARLARALGLPDTLVPTLADWIDADDEPRSNGAESRWYAGRRPPMRPANTLLESVHDLRHLRDVTPDVVTRLAPYVTAHGQPALNPNTAPPDVLAAWLGEPARVRAVLRDRARQPLTCVGFRRCTLRSRRFLLHVRAGVGAIERATDVVVLVAPGLPATIERWGPPLPPPSHRGGERGRTEDLA
jgi:type II secretory pathway component PulK